MPKPASAQADKPPSMGIDPTLGLYTMNLSTVLVPTANPITWRTVRKTALSKEPPILPILILTARLSANAGALIDNTALVTQSWAKTNLAR